MAWGGQFDDGINTIYLALGHITIAVSCEDCRLRFSGDAAMKDFLVNEAQPDVRIQARWGDLSKKACGEMLFDTAVHWQLSRVGQSYVLSFSSPVLWEIPYKLASFNQDFTLGDVYLHRPFFNHGRPVNPLENPLDQLLIANLLARGRGVEIHACGAVDSAGNGHLFVGQSGAGKTTIARLLDKAGGMTILSDDRIIVRKLEGTIWMYGTPWHGDGRFASPARAPVVGVYFLARGLKNELAVERPIKAVGRLFACSFPLFYDPEALNFTLGFLDDVVKTVPCYELKFAPNEKVAGFLSRQMT